MKQLFMMKKFIFFLFTIYFAQAAQAQNNEGVSLGVYPHSDLSFASIDYNGLKYINNIAISNAMVKLSWHDAYLFIHYTPSVSFFTTKTGQSYNYLDFVSDKKDGINGTVTATWRVPNSNETISHTASIVYDTFDNEHSHIVSDPIFVDNKALFGSSCKIIKDSGGQCTKKELANRGFAPQLKSLEFQVKLSGIKYVEERLEKLQKRKELIEKANGLKSSGNCIEAIPLFKEALNVFSGQDWFKKNLNLDDSNIQFNLNQCQTSIEDSAKKESINQLLSNAKEAENQGDLEKAKQLYQQAAQKSNDPQIQNDINRVEEAIKNKVQEAEQQQIEQQQLFQQTTNQPTQLDFFGNPVKNDASGKSTVTYGSMEVENNSTYKQQMQLRQNNANAKAAWEQQEAERRQAIDNHNNTIMQQSNTIYQQSLNIDRDMNDALSQISPETYGDPKAMIQTGMNLLSTANGNLGQAYTGAALSGVGLAAGLLGDLAKAKAKKEAAAERARIRKEAEAKKQAIRESIKKARLAVFEGYPQGELPLSSTASKGSNLYYFVYAYKQDQLLLDNPIVKATNVFAIGKYPDGTWPMKTKIESELNSLTPLKETICGPFYSLSEANSVYQSFLSYADKTNMGIDTISYEGFNAHSETENVQQTTPKLDFWGNPIKN
jgi:hypothetical protein